ncbi:hypothetical protein [Microbacterium sp. Leaf151]|uniref:hypothetical protein n=1 Tax=Microbacterium sp. Leaf151 TaxID=1736276 RepID=UPI0006FEBFE7|nr:hypothetical protein [Microbacterium sp. Leaf151]KQR25777.1 hypothetical protein ASF76_00270 [Microbacterium sp. Leaf151]
MSKSSAKSNASIVNLMVTMVIMGFVFVLAAPSVQSTVAKAATTAEVVENQGSMRNEVSRITATGDLSALDNLEEEFTSGLANIKKSIGDEKVAEAEAEAAPTLRFAKEKTAAVEAANPVLNKTVIDVQDMAPAAATGSTAPSVSIAPAAIAPTLFAGLVVFIVLWTAFNLRKKDNA